jgi:hypothetical protein
VLTEQELRCRLHEAQCHRGWFVGAFAQIEFILGDIIALSLQLPAYTDLKKTLPHSVTQRIARVRAIIGVVGVFQQFADSLEKFLVYFESVIEMRNQLVHGYCTVHHDAEGNFRLEFRKWHRDEDKGLNRQDMMLVTTYPVVEIDYQKTQLEGLLIQLNQVYDQIKTCFVPAPS